MASGSGWNLWVWLAGGGCKEVYRCHTLYPYILLLYLLFFPTFCSFKKMFFVLVPVLFGNLCNIIFSRSINTYRRLRASHRSRMKGCT